MSIFEYDQERHMQQEREAGIEKGERQLLRRLVQKNLARGMSIPEIAEVLDETEERIREESLRGGDWKWRRRKC